MSSEAHHIADLQRAILLKLGTGELSLRGRSTVSSTK